MTYENVRNYLHTNTSLYTVLEEPFRTERCIEQTLNTEFVQGTVEHSAWDEFVLCLCKCPYLLQIA